ncbi:MAG: carbamoyltransferase HypF [Thermoplasmata archaeon]|nr:carbamoyltransferase HypF [Candidatus Thermoplasmatota archaeon]MCK4949983.1 carbamoyltransferase HypF [Thermoplasmata archaeon]
MKFYLYGVVQGVGFRPTVYRVATSLGLKGYVRNNGSNVEVCLNGGEDEFLDMLKAELPPLARIDNIEKVTESCQEMFDTFRIVSSVAGSKEASIPPDIALCDDCISEIFSTKDRRFGFPFTNCTNCGARFSVIRDFPYDRKNTSMSLFELCPTCKKEYADPLNRRFHAQTISCPHDGPRYLLYNDQCVQLPANDSVRRFSEMIDKGKLGIVKSWGGTHMVCTLEQTKRLRSWYNRPYKPFAVMVRDVETAEKYAHISEEAKKLMTSPEAPIVLVPKRHGEHDELLEDVAPGLDSVGLYIPYTGVQHLIFRNIDHDALIMTSANAPGEPMALTHDEAFRLGVEIYLLHNREIINRVDDSVVIPFNGSRFFVRKSRGFVPKPIPILHKKKVLGVGAERNVTSSISRNGELLVSQYIGNTTHYGVFDFQMDATRKLMDLAGIDDLEAVGIDLHPMYTTRRVGKEFAKEFNASVVEIQHHWAHAASLMAEHGLDELVTLTFDGAGYGEDGRIWGGEALSARLDGYERFAHLQYIPLIGGDRAVLEPDRLVFGIFESLRQPKDIFDAEKSRVLRKAMEKAPRTSSFGRVLDALAAYLGVCNRTTYDGEPAMKLERLLAGGKNRFGFQTEARGTNGLEIQTLPLFAQLDSIMSKQEATSQLKADIAHSFVYCLMKKFVELSAAKADEIGSKRIGLSGGVTYNLSIVTMVTELAKERGLEVVLHNRIPNGDGGISTGQNVIVGVRE